MEIKLTLPFGEKLYVGDVVELFNIKKNKIYKEKQFVCYAFQNGIDDFGEWQIRKVKSYDETI